MQLLYKVNVHMSKGVKNKQQGLDMNTRDLYRVWTVLTVFSKVTAEGETYVQFCEKVI